MVHLLIISNHSSKFKRKDLILHVNERISIVMLTWKMFLHQALSHFKNVAVIPHLTFILKPHDFIFYNLPVPFQGYWEPANMENEPS